MTLRGLADTLTVGVRRMRQARRIRSILLGAAVAAPILFGTARAYYSSTWYEGAAGYEQALRQQRLQHVPILVYFRVDWCPHCRVLDDMLDEYEVRSRLNQLIKVRINPERGDEEKQLHEARYGANGYPALFLHPEAGSPTRLSHKGPGDRFLAQLPD